MRLLTAAVIARSLRSVSFPSTRDAKQVERVRPSLAMARPSVLSSVSNRTALQAR